MESHAATLLEGPIASEATLSRTNRVCYSGSIGYLERILTCHRADVAAFVPWFVGGAAVGSVHRERLPLLLAGATPFRREADRVVLAGDGFGERSRKMAAFAEQLAATGEIRALLGELYPVVAELDPNPLLQVDRAAVAWLGVRAFGVHLNGYVRSADGLRLWVAQRSPHKRTFPGHFDNFVAGGQPIGLDPLATLVKECREEAGLPPALASPAVPVGTIRYRQQDGLALKVDRLRCFDLALPASFVPEPVDGEVESFRLQRVCDVAAGLRGDGLWKANSALVTLHFLLRHGLLDGELPASERWQLWRALHGELP